MNNIIEYIGGWLGVDSVLGLILTVLDFAIIVFAIYKLWMILKDTRASGLLKGYIFIFVAVYIAKMLRLHTVSALLKVVLNVLPVMTVVLFAPEIKKLLERLGTKKFRDILRSIRAAETDYDAEVAEKRHVIDEIVSATADLATTKTGALIVIQRRVNVQDWAAQGTIINADLSARLLKQIFVPNTPLHDGAVIVNGDRIYAAQCVLPLTDLSSLSRELGTRHRAAIGASEDADCLVVVVSEENGVISLANNGTLERNFTAETLKKALVEQLIPERRAKDNKAKEGADNE